MATAVKEMLEVGRVLNSTSYVSNFYEPDPKQQVVVQTMLINKASLRKGDYVLARVRYLRNTRQILALEKIESDKLVSLQFESCTGDVKALTPALFIRTAFERGAQQLLGAGEFSEKIVNLLYEVGNLVDQWACSLEVTDKPERHVFEMLPRNDQPNALPATFNGYPLKFSLVNAARICDTINANLAHNQMVYLCIGEGNSATRTESEPPTPPVDVHAAYEWVNGIWVQPDMRGIFPIANNVIELGQHINILLTGPSGYGKTTFFQALADYLEIPLLYVNCATITDTKAWFGTHEARDGSTHFMPSEFTKFIEKGNCVIVLDEANRLEPWLSNSLMPILDHRRQTEVHGRTITAAPGIVFGLTMNIGARYAGVSVVDAAFMNRVDIGAEVEAPPPAIERLILDGRYGMMKSVPHTPTGRANGERINLGQRDIEAIVSVVNELRQFVERNEANLDVSTRTSNKVAKLMTWGATIADAFRFVVVFAADVDTRKGVLDILAAKFSKR
jgi:MoxR-like ATPase